MSTWYDIPKRATPFLAARVQAPTKTIDLRLYEGYTGGRPMLWLAIRWHGPAEQHWNSRCTQYSGKNYRRGLDDYNQNLADGRALGATVTEARTMREVWDQVAA